MENMSKYDWLKMAKRLQAIAQSGLEYCQNQYDIERFQEIRSLSVQIMQDFTGMEMEKLKEVFASDKGYQTPKVDVRGVVFREDKILLVQETIDGNWSVPGGWADVGYTPKEVACKEVFEESGLRVEPVKLLAVLDKRHHNFPLDMYDIYKIFILCREVGGSLKTSIETSDSGFFALHELPPLSTPRITKEQIQLLYEFHNNPDKEAICD
jgi:ADP-ribose pyrophosphatase YjhB (NUDIX family)